MEQDIAEAPLREVSDGERSVLSQEERPESQDPDNCNTGHDITGLNVTPQPDAAGQT